MFCLALLATHLIGCKQTTGYGQSTKPTEFVASSPDADFPLPPIVLPTGINWAEINHPKWFEDTPSITIGRAVLYLREGLEEMTGRKFPVESRTDLSAGIVLVLMSNAPPDIQNDSEVRRALRADPKDPYAATEAFFIRSERKRLLMVANTSDGLCHAVVELLESVGYEVLGMGPNWIHAPNFRHRPLVFALYRAGRPSFYIRRLSVGSGQSYGMGTVISGLTDPADEPVDVSYWRWMIGTHIHGTSMPSFPGHALQAYHARVIDHMRSTGTTEGFLSPKTILSSLPQRPAAGAENQYWMWIDTDPQVPALLSVYYSDGTAWLPGFYWNLDLSVAFVRQLVFDKMISQAKVAFEKSPDDQVIFGMEAEDGARGNALLVERMKNPDWYPQYRAQENLPLGHPYLLHGCKGLNQPSEVWDPSAASDHMFGFAGWLLHEFDKWVDSLPPDQQVTSTGRSKKELIRCSFYSYNYHDVPPNFNPDQRIRVMIAGYPKHRGLGKWTNFVSNADIAAAFQIMLPREPSGDYQIISHSYYQDMGPRGIPNPRSASPSRIAAEYRRAYDLGFRAMHIETDFNFGKSGLAYYLISKMLWDTNLTAADLDAIRDRWFHRAFGSAWREMKAYYDFMLSDNYPVNGPRTWAQAIRLIDAADKKLDGLKEPDAQRRIDDVKQYWYYHYLADSGKFTKDSPDFRIYLWKGQMSYMVPMHMVARRHFDLEFSHDRNAVKSAVGPEISAGAAHYTHAETQIWWTKVLAHWSIMPVRLFSEATLANGRSAQSVDLHDLVRVQEFQNEIPDTPFFYNSGSGYPTVPFLMVAHRKDELLGFRLTWPFRPDNLRYAAKKVPYGVDIWNPARKTWDPWIDMTMATQPSERAIDASGKEIQVVAVQLKAPRPGTYRFEIGPGGDEASLGTFDPQTGNGFTYVTQAEGFTQSPVYFYIPKGSKSLDLEVWDHRKGKFIQLYTGLPASKPTPSRRIDISEMGTHTITLNPGEDGTVAVVTGKLFAFPYLYSVPTLWAKSPAALLVPRAVAEADGLTVLE